MKRENLEKEQETVAQATLFSDQDFEAPRPERVKRTAGLGMRKDFNNYEQFLDKFRHKHTSDDCFTPPLVYEAIKGWVDKNLMSLEGVEICRPFCPGGDYENYDYPGNCLVLDNPPFSILAKIRKFYHDNGIRYFLFAPALTLCSVFLGMETFVVCGYNITYENGAKIPTSFVTNIPCDDRLIVSGTLAQRIKEAEIKVRKETLKWQPPVYVYPSNVPSAALLQKISTKGYDIDLRIPTDECEYIERLDSQKAHKKRIFGAGWLLSDRAAAAAAEHIEWELSDWERKIINRLNGNRDKD